MPRSLSADGGDRTPDLFHPPNHLPLLGAARVRIDTEYGADAGLVLARALDSVNVVLGAADGGDRRVRRDTKRVRSAAAVGSVTTTPRLLEDDRVGASAVVSRDGSPEAGAVGGVDGLETAHVHRVALRVPGTVDWEASAARWRRQGRAVQSESTREAGRRTGRSTGRERWSGAGRGHGVPEGRRGHQRGAVGMRVR